MATKTAFRELAERIAGDIEGKKSTSFFGEYYLCENLLNSELDYIKKYFKPNSEEVVDWSMSDVAWLCNFKYDNSQNNSFRILILLFAEQHYLHYKKK